MVRTKQSAAAKKPAPDRRKKGRPAGREGSIGADQIIDTARILLKDHHPDKLTQASIARAAGVDPKLVRYYFKTLDHLLVELAHRFILDINDRMAGASKIAGTTEEKIARRIRTLLQFYVETPNFWPLIMDKIYLSEDDRARSVRRDFNNTSFQRLSTILLNGIEQKDIRPGIDPRLLYVVLIGVCEIFVTGKPIMDVLFSEYEQESLADLYGNFIIDLVTLGLRPRTA
jgi:TetR/AcrR family transcriptional regulator